MSGTGAPAATSNSRDKTGSEPAGRAAESIRILHVEDSQDDADLILREFQRAGRCVHVLRVETAEEMRAALATPAWDVVISDHSLPTFSAPAAFAVLRESGLDLPFIIVSGTVGEEVAVEAMRTGVHDYLLKENLRRLVGAVEREVREAALRAEQRKIRQQLVIAERMASVGTLAAGVAHEINNPLSVVIGNVQLVWSELDRAASPDGEAVPITVRDLVEQLREPLADVKEAAERVSLIARDLRVFSRADDEARCAVDVRKVMDSSIRMARNEIRHRATIVREYAEVPPIDCNEARLGQVFLNLLVNAAQAIPEGNADDNTITAATRTEGSRVVIEVTDTGAGIAPDVLPRIFDIFFTTKPIGVGTGLGLAICHRIVTGMNGEIAVESRLGRGTTFKLTLPRSRFGKTRELPIVPLPPVSQRRRARVLIVDDEQPVARVLQRSLMQSHDVVCVSSGRHALTCIDDGQGFDVILCDVMMPEMTAVDLHAEILRRSGDLARRMVFMSGGAYTEESRRFLDSVDNHRLDKPVDIVALRRLVDELCNAVQRGG